MPVKSQRLEMRISVEHKRLLEQAAAIRGQPLSSFALARLVEDAEAVVRAHQTTTLSRRDQKLLLDLLENPPDPVPALKEAVKRWKRNRRSLQRA